MGVGDGYVLDAFFGKFLNIFPLPLYPLPPPGGVFLDSFLELLEGYEGYGRGEVVYIHTDALQTRLDILC